MPPKARVKKKVDLSLIRENLGNVWYTRDGSLAVPCWVAPVAVGAEYRVKGYIQRKADEVVYYQDWSWHVNGRSDSEEHFPEDLMYANSKIKVF